MLCRICTVQIHPRKHVRDHAGFTAPTRQHELDHTDHTHHTHHTDHTDHPHHTHHTDHTDRTDHTDHADQDYIFPEEARS